MAKKDRDYLIYGFLMLIIVCVFVYLAVFMGIEKVEVIAGNAAKMDVNGTSNNIKSNFTPLSVIMIAATMVLGSMGFVIAEKDSSKKRLEEEKLNPTELSLARLSHYIQREINCGYTKSEVKQKLALEGWNKNSIEKAFSNVDVPKRKSRIFLENGAEMSLSSRIDSLLRDDNKK